jgi:hypothetical protein
MPRERTRAPVEPSEKMNDATLLDEGKAALRERLGTIGLLRFLALVGGRQERFEDIREAWENKSLDDILQEMQAPAGGEAGK